RIIRTLLETDFSALGGLDADQGGVQQQLYDKLKSVYSSCMDEAAIDKRGAEPVTSFLSEFVSSAFPVVYPIFPSGAYKFDAARFSGTLSTLFGFQIFPLFAVSVQPDPLDPGFPSPTLVPLDNLGLTDRALYEDEDALSVYHGVVARALFLALDGVAENLSVKRAKKPEDWRQWAERIVDFEARLAAITPSFSEVLTSDRSTTTIYELAQTAPKIPWLSIFHTLFQRSVTEVSPVTLVGGLEYYQGLAELLDSVELDVLEGYFLLTAVRKLAPLAGAELRSTFGPVRELLTGVSPVAEPPRSETCVGFLQANLGLAVGKLFVDAAFSPKTKRSIEKVFEGLRETFLEALPTVDWMNAPTCAVAEAKLQGASIAAGYPAALFNATDLGALYAGVSPPEAAASVGTGFFEVALQARRAEAAAGLSRINEMVDAAHLPLPVMSTFARYLPALNTLFMPAGLLQPTCFTRGQPSYLNYGACGTVAAYHIVSGLDNRGRRHDADG
ncbi:hypothetical protein HK405_014117, partial [Cladochytrium tenue]